jgi:hypothetical protein
MMAMVVIVVGIVLFWLAACGVLVAAGIWLIQDGRYHFICPMCLRQQSLFNPSSWPSDVPYATSPAASASVCGRCAKERASEIVLHNRLIQGGVRLKKDPSCEHEWAHWFNNRWACTKCGAQYQWMCGCGGSMYVCEEHHAEFLQEHPDLGAFLTTKSW